MKYKASHGWVRCPCNVRRTAMPVIIEGEFQVFKEVWVRVGKTEFTDKSRDTDGFKLAYFGPKINPPH